MGEKQIIAIIKNSGVMMVALMFIIGVVYTVLDLHIIVVGGENLIVLRLIGVVFVACFAYLPYYVSQKVLLYTKYTSFLFAMWIVLFVGDVIVRFDLVMSFIFLPGFLGVVIYPVFFTSIMSAVVLCEILVRRCKAHNYYCHKFSSVLKNKYEEILLKVKKI